MRSRVLKITAVLVVLSALAAAAYFLPIFDWIAVAQAKIESWGDWAPVAYVLLYVVFTLCLIPGSALTFTAGVLYGVGRGTAISLSASTLAACLAFLASRYIFRERLLRRFGNDPRFMALDRAVARDAWKIVLLMRLSPAFPYVLLNYAFGLTRIRLATFAIFSLLGMVVPTLILVSAAAALGSAAEEASREMSGGHAGTPYLLRERLPLKEGEFVEAVTWLRNRQLVLWRADEPGELEAQRLIADHVSWLADHVRDGKSAPRPRAGESPDKARARSADALRKAQHESREAQRFLESGRSGTARERQKEAASLLLEARGDDRRINWTLWSALAVSVVVTFIVGRIATKALRDVSPAAADTEPPAGA